MRLADTYRLSNQVVDEVASDVTQLLDRVGILAFCFGGGRKLLFQTCYLKPQSLVGLQRCCQFSALLTSVALEILESEIEICALFQIFEGLGKATLEFNSLFRLFDPIFMETH